MHLNFLYCLFATFLVKVYCFPTDAECLKAADFTTVDDFTEVIGEWHYQTNPPNCSLPSQRIRKTTPEDQAKIKEMCGEKLNEFDFKLVISFITTSKDVEESVAGYIGTKGNKTYFAPVMRGCHYIVLMQFRKLGDHIVMLRPTSGELLPFSMKMPKGEKYKCVVTKDSRIDFCDIML